MFKFKKLTEQQKRQKRYDRLSESVCGDLFLGRISGKEAIEEMEYIKQICEIK